MPQINLQYHRRPPDVLKTQFLHFYFLYLGRLTILICLKGEKKHAYVTLGKIAVFALGKARGGGLKKNYG